MAGSAVLGATAEERTLGQRAAAVVSLPSQTALRFLILVVAVLVSSVYVYDALYFTAYLEDEQALLARCTRAARDAPDAVAAQAAQTACRAPAQRDRVLWTVLFAPLTVLVGLALAVLAPWARHRRYDLVPLPAGARQARQRTEAVAGVLGLGHAPALTWQRRRVSGAATAYGLPWRPQVELAPGTVALASIDPERFDALLRHELAHVRNRDVVLGGAAVGSLLAFIVVADLPFTVSVLMADLPLGIEASALLRLALVTGLVFLVQRDVLRMREHEADLRALSVGPAPAGDLLPAQPVRAWRRLLRTHPDPVARTAVLQRPEKLLRVPPVQAAAAGFFAFLPVPVAGGLAAGWLTGTDAGPTGMFLVAAALAVPFGAWAGAVALRLAHDPQGRRTGAGTGLAASAGAATALTAFDNGLYQPVELLSDRGTDALAMLLVVVVMTGLFVWLVDVARCCVARRWSVRRTAVATSALGALSASLLLGALARVWALASVTDAGQAIAKDPALALTEIVFGGSSAWLGLGLMVVVVLPVALALPGRGQWRGAAAPAAVVLVAVTLGAAGGWAAVRMSDARVASLMSAELREQVIVQSRHVLVNQTVGLSTAAVLAAVLMTLAGRRLLVVVAGAVTAAVGTALLQVSTAGGLGPADAAGLMLSGAVPSALVALVAVAALAALQQTSRRLGGPARAALGACGLAIPLAVAAAAAPYIAAPQGALREVPAYAAWTTTTGADVHQVLEQCAAMAAAPPPTLDPAALARVDGALSAVRASTWRSDAFGEAQGDLVAALEQCRAGVQASIAGRPDPIPFRRSLCGYFGALGHLQGIGGVTDPLPLNVLRLCGGRPSTFSVAS